MGSSKNYHQGVKNNFVQREIEFLSYMVMNEIGGQIWGRSTQSKVEEGLDQKMARSLFGLAKYYHRFIQKKFKVARTLSNLLRNGLPKSRMNPVINLRGVHSIVK